MRRRRGLTFTEVVIAVAVIAIAITGIVPAFISYVQVNSRTEVRTGAVAVAQQTLDGLRASPFNTWPASGTEQVIDSGLGNYTARITYCLPTDPGCLSTADSRQVQVVIFLDGEVFYRVETVYTKFD